MLLIYKTDIFVLFVIINKDSLITSTTVMYYHFLKI